MALLQLFLLLLYAVHNGCCLPITSKPLDDTPDNIAWQALLTVDTYRQFPPEHEEGRKIPKSIFITPNLNESCAPGFALGADGKCYKSSNFNLDPVDALKNQIASLFHPPNGDGNNKPITTIDYDIDYDYDSYDSTDSNGPYHVPLTLSFNDDPAFSHNGGDGDKKKTYDRIQNLPFLGGAEIIKSDNLHQSDQTIFGHPAHVKSITTTSTTEPTTSTRSTTPSTTTKTAATSTPTEGTSENSREQQYILSVVPLHPNTISEFNANDENIDDNTTERITLTTKDQNINLVSTKEDVSIKISTINAEESSPTTTSTTKNVVAENTLPVLIIVDDEKTQQDDVVTSITSETKENLTNPTTVSVIIDDENDKINQSSVSNSSLAQHNNGNNDDDDDDDDNDENNENENNKQQIEIIEDLSNMEKNPPQNREIIATTTTGDDRTLLEKELQIESLFQDDEKGSTAVVDASEAGTTESTEDVDLSTVPTEPESSDHATDEQKGENVVPTTLAEESSIKKSIKDEKKSNLKDEPIVVVPTIEQVQIVTPSVQQTTEKTARTSLTVQKYPTTTTNGKIDDDKDLHTDILHIKNDSELTKKLRETVMEHELKQDAIQTTDEHNRFVYTHLETAEPIIVAEADVRTTNLPSTTTTTTVRPKRSTTPSSSSSLSPSPPSTTASSSIFHYQAHHHNFLDQLKFMNKYNDENRRLQSNRIGLIKFPGPVSARTNNNVPIFNRLIPDQHVQRKPITESQRISFPSSRPFHPPSRSSAGWSFDRSIDTASQHTNHYGGNTNQPSSSVHLRTNSKSPTDSLYRASVPASEIYKVLSSKNFKHNNR